MASLGELVSAGLIEKDKHGDVLWTWSYPSVSEEERQLFLHKCCLSSEDKNYPELVYGQFKHQWYYIYTSSAESSALDQVTHFSVVLRTRDFHPEKYLSLSEVMSRQYRRTGSAAIMLESYLGVLTRGVSCSGGAGDDNGKFMTRSFDKQAAYMASEVKDVVLRFQIETILIMTALLLKKKVVVYHPNLEELLRFIRALPALVWHRQNWDILHPNIDVDAKEIDDLQKSSHYVAGSTNAAIETRPLLNKDHTFRSDLYDVFVNLSVGEINVSPQSKEDFAMGKLHKDLALSMLNAASQENTTDQLVIQEISAKVTDLLSKLRSLATEGANGRPCISLEALRERKMPQTTENFLFNLASAEGLVST